jgi:uncharacterized protein YerC
MRNQCPGLDYVHFSFMVFNTIKDFNLTYREVEKESGISRSMLSRIKDGRRIDLDSYLKLVYWMEQKNNIKYETFYFCKFPI